MPASWGLQGLDEAAVERLYSQVIEQTLAGPQPEALKMTYLPEWLEANELAGSPAVVDPKVQLWRPPVPLPCMLVGRCKGASR